MIRLAIVDLDGTLAYTIPGMHKAINAVRKSVGCDEVEESRLFESINNATPGFIKPLIEDTPLKDNLEEAINRYLEVYNKTCIEGSVPYDGIKDTMLKLRDIGMGVVVFSNKDNDRVSMIMRHHFSGVFNEYIGTGIYPGKPDPTGPLAIAKKYGAYPTETIFIGDSEMDIQTAKNSGMVRLSVTWGYRDRDFLIKAGAQYLADKPNDILTVINEINNIQRRGEIK